MRRTRECVLNLASVDNVEAVNRLARKTGSNPVPESKIRRGYRYERDKFGLAGLTPVPSETVSAPCVLECPVNLEATVEAMHNVAEDDAAQRGRIVIFEVRIRSSRRIHFDGGRSQSGRPGQMAAADHELSAILWTRVASAT